MRPSSRLGRSLQPDPASQGSPTQPQGKDLTASLNSLKLKGPAPPSPTKTRGAGRSGQLFPAENSAPRQTPAAPARFQGRRLTGSQKPQSPQLQLGGGGAGQARALRTPAPLRGCLPRQASHLTAEGTLRPSCPPAPTPLPSPEGG